MTAISTAARDEVARQMAGHVAKFATPISVPHPNGVKGEHWGTGNYLELDGRTVLLTNEHVVSRRWTDDITHKFHGHDAIYRLDGHHVEQPWPIDAAVVEMACVAAGPLPHRAAAVPADRVAVAHAPLPGELLFVHGFAGANSLFLGNTLKTDATAILCHEASPPVGIQLGFHFAIDFRRDMAVKIDGLRDGIPNPKGMSGSLVWNTRYLEVTSAGEPWSPDRALATGLVWSFLDEKWLVATRIEHVRSLMLQSVEAFRSIALANASGLAAGV